jgi:hypothetical protein
VGFSVLLSSVIRSWSDTRASVLALVPGLVGWSVTSNGVDAVSVTGFDAANLPIRTLTITRLGNGTWTVA